MLTLGLYDKTDDLSRTLCDKSVYLIPMKRDDKKDKKQRAVHLGFPNAALDSSDVPLDLNKLVVKNRSSTFYMRVEGTSYEELSIYTGDILTIDRSLQLKPGDIFVGSVNGEFIIREYAGETDEEIDFFGVVTHVIHKTRK